MGARKGLPYIADAVPQTDHPDGPPRDIRWRQMNDRPAGHQQLQFRLAPKPLGPQRTPGRYDRAPHPLYLMGAPSSSSEKLAMIWWPLKSSTRMSSTLRRSSAIPSKEP